MAKGSVKSSASSGTRKKHARKAGKDAPIPEDLPKEKRQKGKDKGKSKEPRKKAYIPPVKPAPAQQDPLDSLGLAHQLPPELLIILRRFSKKDAVTKTKALEELQSGWLDKVDPRDEDVGTVDVLTTMLPVWLHHVPVLFLHPSRRIRFLSVTAHASFLRIPRIRDQLLFQLQEVASEDLVESVLGSWCMASRDVDRQVSTVARRAWTAFVSLDPAPGKVVLHGLAMQFLVSFVQRAILDPSGLYLYLNPVHVSVDVTPKKLIRGRPVQAVTPPVPGRNEDDGYMRQRELAEESEADRNARLRVGGLGVLQWLLDTNPSSEQSKAPASLMDTLSNPSLWSGLHHAPTCPYADGESFGFGQPSVRSATWNVLQSLLQCSEVKELLSLLSVAVLRSAFVEPDAQVRVVMWRPFLSFLKEFPTAWEQEAAFQLNMAEDSDEGDEGDEDERKKEEPSAAPPAARSTALKEFLQFLELGCAGSPIQGYPTVIIILSTIPSSILAQADGGVSHPISSFFASFWAAIDGRALSSLERAAASAAFLSSLLECTSFIVRRLRVSSTTSSESSPLLDEGTHVDEAARSLVGEQYGKVWDELAESRLKVDGQVVGSILSKNLLALSQMDEVLFDAAWVQLASAMRASLEVSSPSSQLCFAVLSSFHDTFEDGSCQRSACDGLIHEIAQLAVSQLQTALASRVPSSEAPESFSISLLSDVMVTFGDVLFHDPQLSKALDDAIQANAIQLLSTSPDLLVAYLSRCEGHEVALQLWRFLLSSISANPEFIHTSLPHLVSAVQRSELPDYLKPAEQELDPAISEVFTNAVDNQDAAAVGMLRQVVQSPSHFLTESSVETLLHLTVSKVGEESSIFFFDGQEGDLSRLEVLLDLLSSCFQSRPTFFANQEVSSFLMPEVYILAYLLPRCYQWSGAHHVSVAEMFWKSWLASSSAEARQAVRTSVQECLGVAIFNISARPSPRDILEAVSSHDSFFGLTASDILPSRSRLDDLLQSLRSDPAHSSLAILQPLVPPALSFAVAEDTIVPADRDGLSSYARGVASLLYFFLDNRQAAKGQLWMLRHLLALGLYAEEKLQVPALSSPSFGADIPADVLLDILGRAQQMSAYLLVVPGEPQWHASVTAVAASGRGNGPLDGVGEFIVDLVKVAQTDDSYRDSRVLFEVLRHVINDANQEEGDAWMVLARKLEKNAPQTSLAIVHSLARFGPEPPRLDRYRNELAANIIGIPASKANTDGLLLLRRLAASAPDPESDVAFLPQPRAVNFMKACEQWLSSDEDIEEDVECEATLVFYHLVPILQSVSGAHWELIFDVVESNFENSSFNDDETLIVLWRTIKLIEMVQDMATTNKVLRAQWQERRSSILLLVRDLIALEPKNVVYSEPRSACREAVLGLVQNLPSSLMDHETLSKMSHLLSDPSSKVQQMAYDLLRAAAQKRTEHLVVEAAVDTESQVKIELPSELIALLQQVLDLAEIETKPASKLFGYLLGWKLAFDLFENASAKVKSGYSEHLIRSDLIGMHFVPTMLHILNLYGGFNKAFKLDVWEVDEFYVDQCDPDDLLSIRLLTAHVYYRSLLTVSSLVRECLTRFKDKNLVSAVSTYTSTYFSPVIIRNELAQVKSAVAASELSGETLSVKVAPSVREVTAVYTVDEQKLEMTLKVPPEWPLEKMEVKSSKRVGLTEVRWRGLMLGVQQIVWSQNGRIVDAIILFNKNIMLFFEGKVECPICYCIVGLVEGDLPKLQCKTCKNKFHPACLYKWFASSHSSSCPLCRSAIL